MDAVDAVEELRALSPDVAVSYRPGATCGGACPAISGSPPVPPPHDDSPAS